MGLQDAARYWNATDAERQRSYPCDSYLAQPYEGWVRAIDIDAPPQVVFRWLCQLKVAPYSYDWIDNGGRRSPRTLTPGVEQLAVGDQFLIFRIDEFERDHHISGVALPQFQRLYGPLAISYLVQPRGATASRLVVRLDAAAAGALSRLRRRLLAWGDRLMMAKQLRTIKELTEEQWQAAHGRTS